MNLYHFLCKCNKIKNLREKLSNKNCFFLDFCSIQSRRHYGKNLYFAIYLYNFFFLWKEIKLSTWWNSEQANLIKLNLIIYIKCHIYTIIANWTEKILKEVPAKFPVKKNYISPVTFSCVLKKLTLLMLHGDALHPRFWVLCCNCKDNVDEFLGPAEVKYKSKLATMLPFLQIKTLAFNYKNIQCTLWFKLLGYLYLSIWIIILQKCT